MDKRASFYGMVALVAVLAAVLVLFHANPAGAAPTYQLHKLASDIVGFADNYDPNIKNPWGISSSATSPFWISDNRAGLATLYNGSGQPFPVGSPLVVTIPPPPGGTSPSTPTGQVFNAGSGFEVSSGNPAHFIFATEDGTISGWNPSANPTNAILKVDNSASDAVYKGLAIGTIASGDFLYAANFHAGTIDVFDSSFAPTTLAGSFSDPNLPSGFAPFNIQNLGGNLYVTYAMHDATGHDDVPGPGNGFVDVFDLNGNLVKRLISDGPLNSPWGLALAPSNFGDFSNTLLVGNFGDGLINAFDPSTGAFLGQIQDAWRNPIIIKGLWGLKFGNGGNGGDSNTMYFTAGIPGPPPGEVEDHGLFGSIQPVQPAPVPAMTREGLTAFVLLLAGSMFVVLRRKSRRA
jgi:uncharacterized protein (TIGR03118 family)